MILVTGAGGKSGKAVLTRWSRAARRCVPL